MSRNYLQRLLLCSFALPLSPCCLASVCVEAVSCCEGVFFFLFLVCFCFLPVLKDPDFLFSTCSLQTCFSFSLFFFSIFLSSDGFFPSFLFLFLTCFFIFSNKFSVASLSLCSYFKRKPRAFSVSVPRVRYFL